MRDAEKRGYKSVLVLKNVGRCPTCGNTCAMPCARCNHPKTLAEQAREREREFAREMARRHR